MTRRSVTSRGWLTRNLRVVSGVSFLQDAASELLYPIMPIFLTAVLGAPVAVVSLVEGIAEAAAAAMRLAAGRLSDRFQRRPLIGLGYGLAAVGKVLVAAAQAWPVVLAGRVVDRLGKGIRGTPRDALIAADVPAGARGRAFGLHRAADTAGAVVGPLLGLALYRLLDGRIRPMLVVAVVPAIASVLLVAALREPRGAAPASTVPGGAAPIRGVPGGAVPAGVAEDGGSHGVADLRGAGSGRAVESRVGPSVFSRRYWTVVGVLTTFALINFPDALVLLRLRDIGFTVPAVITAYVLYNAVYSVLSLPAGVFTDRLDPAVVFGVGLACFAVAYFGLGITRSHAAAWVLVGVYGGFTACTDGVGKAWVSGLLPAHLQGSGQGYFQSLTGFGVLGASVWAGVAWGGDGSAPLLVSGIGAAVLALVVMVALRRPYRSERARDLLRSHPGRTSGAS